MSYNKFDKLSLPDPQDCSATLLVSISLLASQFSESAWPSVFSSQNYPGGFRRPVDLNVHFERHFQLRCQLFPIALVSI